MTRAVALVIDSLVLWLIAIVVGASVEGLISLFTGHTDLGSAAILFTGIAWFFWAGLYFTTFWNLTGETPGNRMLGIRVTSLDGGDIGAWQSFRRYFGLLLAVLTLGLGFLPVLFNEQRRGLHDWIGGTVVRWVEQVELVGAKQVPVSGSADRALTEGAASAPAASPTGGSWATGEQGPRLQ